MNPRAVKVSLSIDPDRLDCLRKVAKSQHRTVSNLIQVFIQDYTAKHGTPEMLARLNRDLEHVSNA